MSHHLGVLAEQAYQRLGHYESLFFEGRWLTSTEIHERSTRVAAGLRAHGVRPGDRVVVMTMNTPEVFISYRAIWRAGAVVTPVIFLQSEPELRHILTDSGATAAIISPELAGLFGKAADGLGITTFVIGGNYADLETGEPAGIEPRADDDLAALLYTGGTTGRAKGVMLSHRGLWENGRGIEKVARSANTTRSLLPLPLSHAYGLIVVIGGLHSERRLVSVLQRWFDPAGWLELVAEHRLESSPVVPTMLQMLLAQPYGDYDLSSLRSFGSGGATLPPAIRAAAEKAFGVTVLQGYGLTETSAVVSAESLTEHRAGSVGKPLPHAEVAIIDGEICVRGPGVMLGYWNDPDLTARTIRDGWLHTGDIGRLDDDGYLYVVDRMKDLIIRGGFNVYPRDVEDVLLEHPAVQVAACVGRPDEESGEEVVAVVQLAPGQQATGAELVAFTRDRMARYKYPREVTVLDAVPLTSVGKINRKAVRDLFRQS
ncbi:long-chain acyl-CoA synthetase [Actinoplanes campanulatus]|uniref:Long-chain acyl-CoA synthetase n=1 Tax=Actinoplanes campanulatus TaxID=113559 RepID=A0A7W5AH99_9ACTN|nr:AMP-binding protein [Actinoplanes campanulatus]MBB3095929.1 long-chain acyl-CoA synthetase [Actinoplanes campanulatus]GGN12486.1 long-chain fatty acid--CoA ligase [Actinoplanes campanulatus]GID36976.1 long-chain fatty acid--CoA ligase [Actinoplanes campanulatus]